MAKFAVHLYGTTKAWLNLSVEAENEEAAETKALEYAKKIADDPNKWETTEDEISDIEVNETEDAASFCGTYFHAELNAAGEWVDGPITTKYVEDLHAENQRLREEQEKSVDSFFYSETKTQEVN